MVKDGSLGLSLIPLPTHASLTSTVQSQLPSPGTDGPGPLSLNPPMRVAITGATGYLGSHLATALLKRGDAVVVLTRSPTDLRRLEAYRTRLEIHPYDAQGMRSALATGPIGAVIHAAACYGRQGESADALIEANVRLPLSIALAAGTHIGRWIAIGSALPATVSPYALSKAQFAAWLAVMPASVLAPRFHLAFQHFYGPGDDLTKFTTHVIRTCLTGGELRLTAGTQRRDFLYIDDAVSAVLTVLDKAEPTALCSDIPVGTGQAVPVRHFIERAHAAAASTTTLHFGAVAVRPGEPDICVADTTVLNRLGWHPAVTLECGLMQTIAAESPISKTKDS